MAVQAGSDDPAVVNLAGRVGAKDESNGSWEEKAEGKGKET
jgi:hypothetical protein